MKYTLLFMTLLFSASAIADNLPPGWMYTSPNQYLKEDITWFKGILPNKVVADFNGDNISDTAWLLTNNNKTKLGLFVSLSNKSGKHKIIKLNVAKIDEHIFMGISAQKPGEYFTACGKGYGHCGKNKPTKVEKPGSEHNCF